MSRVNGVPTSSAIGCGQGLLIALVLVPALVAFLIALMFAPAYWLLLRLAIWLWWCPRGKNILFVYSDSPIWHDHLEREVLPHIKRQAVVLNWSERKRWRVSLASLAFRHFGGDREYNPMGVVFYPFGETRVFRFWNAYRRFKHGKADAIDDTIDEFLTVAAWRRGERHISHREKPVLPEQSNDEGK